MERRVGLRARTEFPVLERDGGFSYWHVALDVSPGGMMIDREAHADQRRQTLLQLELHLPELAAPLRVLATPVWADGSLQGLRFVGLDDADRLTLAEQLDALSLRGAELH
jgi:hypothetical protein